MHAFLHCVPTGWAHPYKGVPGILWADTYPIQSEPYVYAFICIFTDQSEQLYNNPLEHAFMANKNTLFRPNCKVEFLICIKMDQLGIRVSRSPLCLLGVQFGFAPEPAFYPVCKCFTWRMFPFIASQVGDSYWHWVGGSHLLLTTVCC